MVCNNLLDVLSFLTRLFIHLVELVEKFRDSNQRKLLVYNQIVCQLQQDPFVVLAVDHRKQYKGKVFRVSDE